VPASFILAVILLGNEEIQEELGVILALPEGYNIVKEKADIIERESISHENLDIEEKIIFEMWHKSIITASLENPYKILRTVKDFDGLIKSTAIQLFAFIIRDYFEKKSKTNFDFLQIHEFAEFVLKGILDEIKKYTEQFQLEEHKNT
jgi:hypothetical protein